MRWRGDWTMRSACGSPPNSVAGMDEIRPLDPADVLPGSPIGAGVLALNNQHAVELSCLDAERLAWLVSQAFLARHIGGVDAFLLAFDQDADYDSPNFLWFAARHRRFVYVDRIVVAPGARGRGHARRLYEDLFGEALRRGHDHVVCEVNLDPPNAASDAFHAALGFAEISNATIHGGRKTVRYLERPLAVQARAFKRSRISSRSCSCLVGGAGGGGAACSSWNMRLIALIARNSTQAMIRKFTVTVRKAP